MIEKVEKKSNVLRLYAPSPEAEAKNWLNSQKGAGEMHQKSQCPSPIDLAVAEQAKCVLPEPVYDKFGRTVKGLWKRNRRRTETIFIEAADKTKEIEAQNNPRNGKHSKRRRKRGPRVLVAGINKFSPKE